MISVEFVYWLTGVLLLAWAGLIAADRTHSHRWGSASFWGLLGLCFFYGTWVVNKQAPGWILGVAVLVLVVLASTGIMKDGKARTNSEEEREALASKLGNKLFVPALAVPVTTVVLVLAAPYLKIGGQALLDPKNTTLVALGIGAVVAVFVGLIVLRPKRATEPITESRRLVEAIGWAALLPQMLSTLGILFTKAGVGTAVGQVIKAVVPGNSLLLSVAVYCIGMFLFTILMGNGFAAFPIMTAAIGWPVLVQGFHGEPAIVFAIGMLAAFCGTLCTPMAANFNLVPVALLEMDSQYGVIKAQIPTALVLLVANIGLMYLFAF